MSAINRRDFIGGVCCAPLLPQLTRAATVPDAISRPIPSSGERLPVIGLGTDAFRSDLSTEIRAELQRMS